MLITISRPYRLYRSSSLMNASASSSVRLVVAFSPSSPSLPVSSLPPSPVGFSFLFFSELAGSAAAGKGAVGKRGFCGLSRSSSACEQP